ncbi:MAG: InlB B-repeat-containing protein [Ruminococcus sp.]|nr:InlB B-repeat-containing protein [Ruminococcus sp.]
MKRFFKDKFNIRVTSLIIVLVLMFELIAATVSAVTYYTVRVNYYFTNGSHAHDPYIATYSVGEALNYDVTNPNVNGFEPMALSNSENDPTELPTGGVSAPTTHIETVSLNGDMTYNVYYVAGLTHYAARYYLQNIYDDLYTLDSDRTNANQNRLGKTGTAPADLEAETIPGFTSLFHEPDAIAADGSTVFRVYYDRNYYSINFDLGEGGYGVEPVYAKFGTSYRIETPTRMGYTFLGWARTDKDSSTTTYDATGEDEDGWHYIEANTDATNDNPNEPFDYSSHIINEATATSNLIQFDGNQTVPSYNAHYRAIWAPGTTHFTVMYWFENADNDGYTALLAKDVYQTKDNGQMVDVHAGTTVTSDTVIRNYAEKARQEGVYNSSTGCKSEIAIDDLFSFNLNYADPDNALNDDPDPDAFEYKYDKNGVPIDFKDISPGTSNELAGCGDFFEMNTSDDESVDEEYRTDASITVKGDGTSRFNVFFRRKRFKLKFYYARQGYTNGELDPNKISLTNSTKAFNNNSSEKEYLKTTSKNVLEAIAMGSWEPNSAETLPTVKDEYKHCVTEGYDDFTDAHYGGYYRYYYYQWQAKYNEPLTKKWLIDALDTVHRKGAGEAEICYPGSIATEYYNKYYQDRSSSGNYTVKGIYEKLDKGIMLTESTRNTMKRQNIDYTELHFLISWTNTSYNNGWNSSIQRVLHFKYENYVELLPREIEIIEKNGEQALLAEGNYESVRTFTTKVKENDTYVEKTKWYGLSTNHVYETIDSGNQYDPGKDKTKEARKNQTPTQMTGFEIEYLRTKNGLITLDDYNTIVDWSQDTTNYRRCTIKFFYRRLSYTLKYRNGNRKDESRTRTVMYGAPINSQYIVSENGHEVNEYRYYWPDPEYFDPNRSDFYTFECWYNDPRYEEPFDLATQTMPADDYTLFAKWVPKSIDVIFYDDYDDFYIDRKGNHPEKRMVLGKDEDENDIRNINVDYGTYVPLMSIPVDDDSPDNPRPKLSPIAEGASFAGWYYIRNRVPVRFEPENVPVTALNEEATGENGKLRLFAEWVTKDVAKYKVKYVKAEDNDVEIAPPTTGRAYVYKTKTFNAKSGNELYDEYKWDEEKEDEGTNWWPTSNSSSMVIKANNTSDEFEPNTITFEYIQKSKVWYKVQYLDASSRKPLYEEVVKDTTHASVKEDARIIPGYVAREASQSLVLTASNNTTDDGEAKEEELNYNVITFLYDENKTEYMYEVEYLTQDLGADTYSKYSSETLTIPIVTQGEAVNLSISALINREIPNYLISSGYNRVTNGCKYTVTNSGGVKDPTEIPVADNGTVSISGNDKKTIKIYFDRNSYKYKYQYVDHTAEKAYLNYLEAHKDDPDPAAGAPWDGVMRTFDKDSNDRDLTGQVEEEITINPETDITDVDQNDGQTYNYTRITNSDGELNPVKLTVQSTESWNTVKIYYRKDIERELSYKMVCVNDNSDTDYYNDGTPKFGRLNLSMQTVVDYDSIANVTFYDNNTEKDEYDNYLHLHRYTFLGWYNTPNYDKDHPEVGRITTSATLSKDLLGTNGALPSKDTKYYALVKQDMVKMDVMFYYVDDYTVDTFRAEDEDNGLTDRIQTAVNNYDNENASDSEKIHDTGEHVGKQVTFTAPNGYVNHTEIPWHRNGGYSLNMDDLDERVYKYKFAEWWEVDESNNNALIRHDNWNSADGWDPDQLSQQLSRNRNQYLIAVYARRTDVTELPYKINYKYTDRTGVERTYVKKDTLTGDALNESSPNCKITDDGYYRLKTDFIMSMAPYESNYGEKITWSDAEGYVNSTSEKNDSGSGSVGNLIATVTAKQSKKTVFANYRTTTDGSYETITARIGDNYELNDNMKNIEAEETDSNGCKFSHWEVRKTENGNVIAVSKSRRFDLCMMDTYFISPVYEAAPRGSGEYTATLDRSQLTTNATEDWLAWTFDNGAASGEGEWIRPDGMTFRGLKEKVIFVRLGVGDTPNSTWSNVWNQTDNLDVTDGGTFMLTGYDQYNKMTGSWTETPDDDPSVKLTHISYNRNRWTDDDGEIAASGDTDLLYTDFEIAFADNDRIQNSDDYKLGVVFELCAQLPESATFDPTRDYNQVSDSANLTAAIQSAIDGGKTSGSYVYNPSKPSKKRNFQLSNISTSSITNRDRVKFAKPYKNTYKVTGEGAIQYTNSTYLMKATAYIIKDGTVTLSNSIYICLKNEAGKDLAVGNMPVGDDGS